MALGHHRPAERQARADALATDPQAERVPGTLERRDVPDGPDEHQLTDAWRRG